MSTKAFKVAAISENANSFGLRGHILVARDGEAWVVGRSIANPEPWTQGKTIDVPYSSRLLLWSNVGCEIPRKLPDATDDGIRKLWGEASAAPTTIIELEPNGDPFGRGFVGSQSEDGGESWFHRGDLGTKTRQFWRNYCRKHGYRLRECR